MPGKRTAFKGDYLRPLTIDEGSRDAVTHYGGGSHHFTGVMRLSTGVIYLGLLRGEGDDPYNATEHPAVKADRSAGGLGLTTCAGKLLQSLTHNNATGATGHDGLCMHVISCLGEGADTTDFCGFAVRLKGQRNGYSPLMAKVKLAELAPTSRSLNPNYNGTLEETLFEAVYATLKPFLSSLGYTLLRSMPRVDAQAANAAKAAGRPVSQSAVQMRGNVFASLLSTVKKQ